MSLTLKLGSLAIRTLAKPIGVSNMSIRCGLSPNFLFPRQNYIKRNAREHERFRRICVSFAQSLHRIDMRLRLGLLQDPAVIERQIERELKEAEAKRKRDAVPTVKTEADTKAEEEARKKERQQVKEQIKASQKPPRIRPLSESKAIETGANFISETFLFLVAAGAVVFESWRSRRKENNRREGIDDRLEELERERVEMKAMIDLLQSEIAVLTEQQHLTPTQAVAGHPPSPETPDLQSSKSTSKS